MWSVLWRQTGYPSKPVSVINWPPVKLLLKSCLLTINLRNTFRKLYCYCIDADHLQVLHDWLPNWARFERVVDSCVNSLLLKFFSRVIDAMTLVYFIHSQTGEKSIIYPYRREIYWLGQLHLVESRRPRGDLAKIHHKAQPPHYDYEVSTPFHSTPLLHQMILWFYHPFSLVKIRSNCHRKSQNTSPQLNHF